jgi:hypothetical protein
MSDGLSHAFTFVWRRPSRPIDWMPIPQWTRHHLGHADHRRLHIATGTLLADATATPVGLGVEGVASNEHRGLAEELRRAVLVGGGKGPCGRSPPASRCASADWGALGASSMVRRQPGSTARGRPRSRPASCLCLTLQGGCRWHRGEPTGLHDGRVACGDRLGERARHKVAQRRVHAPLVESWMRRAGSLQESLAQDTLLDKMRYSS